MTTIKIRTLVQWLGSGWMFAFTALLFTVEAGRLAVTSRFPGAFDETYHFNLIQFFSDRLNPILIHQSADTYRFGPLVHNPPFLYHYLLSFPYRIVEFFTDDRVLQVVCLRLLNVALVVASLIVMRAFLRLLRVSDPLANLLLLAFALTPLTPLMASQINYDNLLVLLVAISMYLTVVFTRQLNKNRFNITVLAALLCVCLFSSLIKFAFLPIFIAVFAVVAWKIISSWRTRASRMRRQMKEGLASMPGYVKGLLLVAILLGSLLFSWFYFVNMAVYHSPAPQCDQIWTVEKCEHYYAWHNSHAKQTYHETYPSKEGFGIAQYTVFWFMSNTVQLFGAQVPLQGSLYVPLPYLLVVALIGTATFVCMAVYFRQLIKQNPSLLILAIVSGTYLLSLWARNYQDYLRVGEPAFIHGRYLIPILLYVYVLLASGIKYALDGLRFNPSLVKTVLAAVMILTFVYYGGCRPYLHYVEPRYGRLSPENGFILHDATSAKSDL